jgi:hypothetical protein
MPIAHCIVIFPFPGLVRGSRSHQLFTRLLDQCRQSSGGRAPIVVYDRRSREPKDTRIILQDLQDSIERVDTWGVDTCQDWLAGWGHVLDSVEGEESNHRVVLLPGDLVRVTDEDKLFARIDEFIRFDGASFLIGDFDSDNPYSTKELIDTYGVFLLIANWFPEAWQAIQARHIRKPRSEFTNISVPELRDLLKSRVFAYEQTLNMLIVKWHSCKNRAFGNIPQANEYWREEVATMYLGKIADDPSDRHYRGAIDQIERTERLLRMLWRELRGWNPNLVLDLFRSLMEEYERLDERSTRIRDAARIAIWAQLNRDQN